MNDIEIINLSGVVNKIVYTGEGGYTIALIQPEKEFFDVSIKGVMNLHVGQIYNFEGYYKEDERFGDFFQVQRYDKPKLTDKDEIINYLTSKAFEGIGMRTALKVYNAFGSDSLDIIKNEPEKLRELKIPESYVQELHSKLSTTDVLNDLYKVLASLGFSEFIIQEIYRYFKINEIENPIANLKNNPFDYIDKINGYTFGRADSIFLANNGNENDTSRISAAISSSITAFCNKTGDTCVLKEHVKNLCEQLIGFSITNFNEYYEQAIKDKLIYECDDYVQTKEYYFTEIGIAKNVLMRMDAIIQKFDEHTIEPVINILENSFKINYSAIQKSAIKNALLNNISIITGGPGTGKTTIIKAIVNIYEELKFGVGIESDLSNKIMLCAPTGRAAQRMKEATGFSSKTIHSLLGWDPHSGTFKRGLENPLPHELIIIDEFSMVDIFLCHSLLKAIRPSTIIIIVGDEAQLESVNPGNVLGDLMSFQNVPRVQLDQIFRQGDGSTIAMLARQIDKNEHIELVSTTDMGVIPKLGDIVMDVKSIQQKSYKAGYSENEVQVLYPKYKGVNGIDRLNQVLKPSLDSDANILIHGENEYQVGDKIMQLKNNYDKDIYNGDIGFVTKIFNSDARGKELAMEVEIRGLLIQLAKSDLDNITHAYAISIHKAQGSEFKVVIVPVTRESKNMLTKKLLYTAISRSKDKLIIVGDINCFLEGVCASDQVRNTCLVTYLEENQKREKSIVDFL
jgi:exodeoxyribonuclease V alpha subunit